ncbi:fungal-specific transcription factor domain-containing protein [Astrocystis sublimbata]|nr:fungal-specific transcription factor domain-containing protein [Astrocystis sublimbata]
MPRPPSNIDGFRDEITAMYEAGTPVREIYDQIVQNGCQCNIRTLDRRLAKWNLIGRRGPYQTDEVLSRIQFLYFVRGWKDELIQDDLNKAGIPISNRTIQRIRNGHGMRRRYYTDESREQAEAIRRATQEVLPLSDDENAPQRPALVQAGTSNNSDVDSSEEPTRGNHATQVFDVVDTITEDNGPREEPENAGNDTLASLRRLARALDDTNTTRDMSFPEIKDFEPQDKASMPPIEAAVNVLRWAKDHELFFRIEAVFRILPLKRFGELCQKVYFAADEYSQFDFILVNSYLSYLFSEFIVTTGRSRYLEHYTKCRQNALAALSRLPLLLLPTTETIAVLAFGALYAAESSRAMLAWTYISHAANMCQTLGLHRLAAPYDTAKEAQNILFWLIYSLDKSIALRLNRSSNFRDNEVCSPLPSNPSFDICARTSRIQGKIYEHLYSLPALARSDAERGMKAQTLASELREIISESKSAVNSHSSVIKALTDTMRTVYLKIELVKQLSLLTLILRAVPAVEGSLTTITDECATAARETLELHHQAMTVIKDSKGGFLTHEYLRWGILHTPFVAFMVLFTRIVQLADGAHLYYLDRFLESLRYGASSAGSITHPYRLFKLLCEAARLYIRQRPPNSTQDTNMDIDIDWSVFGFLSFVNEGGAGMVDLDMDQPFSHGLGHWFSGYQKLMGLLDEDVKV